MDLNQIDSLHDKLNESLFIKRHELKVIGVKPSFVVMNPRDYYAFKSFIPNTTQNDTMKYQNCEVLRSQDVKEGEFKIG